MSHDCELFLADRTYFEDGFIFFKIQFSGAFCDKFWSLEFQVEADENQSPFDAKLHAQVPSELAEIYLRLIQANLPKSVEPYVRDTILSYHVNAHKMQAGDQIELHNDARMGAAGFPDILAWICKAEDFSGRDFLFGSKAKFDSIKPQTGLICLMNSTDKTFLHGVTELETPTEIITIVASFDGR